jgi:NAD(P)-dependent dehydrogenase (short-subunit alcohol dehydrogenase family)
MKKYLIIGGQGGIGFALTKDLLAKQEEVTVLGRQIKEEKCLPGAKYVNCDVTAPISEFPEIEGEIDGLIYCVGTIVLKPFRALKQEDFLNDLQVNYLGAIKCIQKYLPNLQKSEGASIVLFSSVAVQKGMSFHSSIAGAKGAIEGLTVSLAAEFAPKIRVNAIAPSLTNTPLAEKLVNTESKLQSAADRHPMKRIGEPNDMVDAVNYLLNASWVSGQILAVDGGMSTIGN